MSRYQEEYERYYKKYCQIMMIDIYDFFVTANHEMICSKLDDIACHRIDSSKELMATDEVCIYLNNNSIETFLEDQMTLSLFSSI
jgi:hypothetical protein